MSKALSQMTSGASARLAGSGRLSSTVGIVLDGVAGAVAAPLRPATATGVRGVRSELPPRTQLSPTPDRDGEVASPDRILLVIHSSVLASIDTMIGG